MKIDNTFFDNEVYGETLSNALVKTYNEIPTLDSSVDYWLTRAKGGLYYTDFNINSYIGIEWNEITLSDIKGVNNSKDSLKAILREKLNKKQNIEDNLIDSEDYSFTNDDIITEKQYGILAGQLLRFVNNIKINDIVVVPSENSEFLLVGKITGDIYELSDEDILNEEKTFNYKKSNFKKRWPITWFGSFDRNNADSKLYKMIYAQKTLSNINDYKPFINRAIFPYYLQDDKLYISMHVSQPNDIDSEYLGQFIYQYSQLSRTINKTNKVISKVNVQSEGVIELISQFAPYGLGVFALLAIGLIAPHGGNLKILGLQIEVPGFLNSSKDNNKKKISNDRDKIALIKEAVALSTELQVPISELGINLPKGLVSILDKNIKDENEKETIKIDDSSQKTD